MFLSDFTLYLNIALNPTENTVVSQIYSFIAL